MACSGPILVMTYLSRNCKRACTALVWVRFAHKKPKNAKICDFLSSSLHWLIGNCLEFLVGLSISKPTRHDDGCGETGAGKLPIMIGIKAKYYYEQARQAHSFMQTCWAPNKFVNRPVSHHFIGLFKAFMHHHRKKSIIQTAITIRLWIICCALTFSQRNQRASRPVSV